MRRITAGIALVVLSSCTGPGDPFADAEETARWANAASAVGAWTRVHDPVAIALGEHSYADPECPVVEDDGTTMTVTGDCTDSEGEIWTGELIVTRRGGRDLDLSFEDFGHGDDEMFIATTDGEASVREVGTDRYEYELDLVTDSGVVTITEYSGSVEGDFGAPTTWNGSGKIRREGILPPTGTIRAATEDQRLDDSICGNQAVSGTTTLMDNGHTAVIEYDGKDDCDEEQAAKWSVDGTDRGKIEGISCAVTGDTRTGPALCSLLLVVFGLRRRRR